MRRNLRVTLWGAILLSLAALLSVFVFCFFGVPAQKTEAAQAPGAPGGATHPVLVELFTSEGCSSCPPADALLESLDDQPIPGLQLIVLSEHVTYWDHDGWKDPNSSSLLTDRQSSYEDALGLNSPYTPQIIVDGTRILRVGDRQGAREILEKEKATSNFPMRIEALTVNNGNPAALRARIATDRAGDRQSGEVYVALALNRVESEVSSGENNGRHLVHVAVVTQLMKIGKLQKGETFEHEVEFRLSAKEDPKNMRVVAFVQEPGPGKVLGAVVRKPIS